MSNHTPAPWIAVGAWVEIEDDDIADICSCNPESINQEGRSYEEMCANANLIAAAPELLEACRYAILPIAHLLDLGNLEYRKVYEELDAAIKKATGYPKGGDDEH